MQTRPDQSGIEIEVLAATATAAVEWVWSAFPGRVCVLSSMQDAVVVDLAMRVDRRIPVVFLDTGYHFAETIETVARVEDRYRIRVEVVRSRTAVRRDVDQGSAAPTKPTCCAEH